MISKSIKTKKLNKDELDSIIEKIESSNSTETAYFEINQYGGGPDESYVKANKEGLQLFAAQFLKASRDTEDDIEKANENFRTLDYNDDWVDGETFIHYVELIDKDRKLIHKENYNPTALESWLPYGCILVLILLAVSMIVGFVTIIKWIHLLF